MAADLDRKKLFCNVKRIVVKVGTSSLTGRDLRLDKRKIKKLAGDITSLRKNNVEVILVSSGAIGAGIGELDLKRKPRDMPLLQATAAVGQSILMKAYEEQFKKHGQKIAQVLLTREDFFDRRRYLNARNTLMTLLRLGVVPIINENDTVSVDEIRLGDNDNLSALVSANLDVDLLVMLSDVKGLYTWDPRKSRKAELIKVVDGITPAIERLGGKGTARGVGGMQTKIQAAKITSNSGIPAVIADGSGRNILQRVVGGEDVGTLFMPKQKLSEREGWIRFASTVKGKIVVDDGARKALVERGGSLLPSGVTDVEGNFEAGDTVSIVDSRDVEVARGIVNYGMGDASKIKGAHTDEIEKILGYKRYDELVSRCNIVLVDLE